jgi:hypothetical protein
MRWVDAICIIASIVAGIVLRHNWSGIMESSEKAFKLYGKRCALM